MQETQHSLPFLGETLLFLTLAGILIPLLQRLRVNQVLGFLAAGTLLGPFGLGLWTAQYPLLSYFTFHDTHAVSRLAELGVLFLMFMIGLELSAKRLLALRRWVFGAGAAQVGMTALIIGVIAWSFGNRPQAALVLGLVLSLSSTAVAMQIMSEQRIVSTPLGQAGFAILMFQDLAVVPLLVLIDVLGRGSGDDATSQLALALLKSAGAVLAIYLIGRRLIRPLFHSLVRHGKPEVFVALTLLSTLGIAALTAASGLSMALGALLAGLLLAETEFKHEVELTIEPFKGLLMGLFFMSVGMGIDVREVLRFPLWLPLSVLGLIVIKSAVITLILRAGRLGWGDAVQGGLLLGQGGEFAFIVVGAAIGIGFLDRDVGQFILLVVGLSLFATPLAARLGAMIGSRWQRHTQAAQPLPEAARMNGEHQQVIIAGFGRVGRMLGQVLSTQGIPYIAFETDATVVARERALGFPLFYGNASRTELLRKVHAQHAAAIILTMNHPASVLHAVKAIRREFPEVPLFVRSHDEKHAAILKNAGATVVVPEALEASLQLSAHVLKSLGIGDERTAAAIDAQRRHYAGLIERSQEV